MIPTIALMIAVYGSARLLNDVTRQEEHDFAKALTFFGSIIAVGVLWYLAMQIVRAGAAIQPF